MFDRFCVLLARLYPAEFSRAYSDEAVRLIRDRVRHERGVIPRIRLVIDLATDLLGIWLRSRPRHAMSYARIAGMPSFQVIEARRPRTEALAGGVLLSMLLFGGFALLFQPKTPPMRATNDRPSRTHAPVRGAGVDESASAAKIASSGRHQLVAVLADTVRHRYFDRTAGDRLADTLLARDKKGDYEAIPDDVKLAAQLNVDLQSASRGLGIPAGVFVADVVYSERPLPTGPPPPMTEDMRRRNRAALLAEHCLFEKVEMLPREIGYVKLNGFADPSICHETASHAMAAVNTARALIVDLRDNAGGIGDTALQIAGYVFDRPTFMFDPRAGSAVPPTTASPIPGNRLADKPVFVITSAATQSAAEYFVYNMKMLKRVTIVGERTAGHEHAGGFYRIDDHFGIGIQDAKPPASPYSIKGWEALGVEPDVQARRTDAFEVAKKLAESRVSVPIRKRSGP